MYVCILVIVCCLLTDKCYFAQADNLKEIHDQFPEVCVCVLVCECVCVRESVCVY